MHYEIHEGIVERDTVCIHGNLASNAWWAPAIEVWKRKSAGRGLKGRLVCAEWRGCGRSKGLVSQEDLRLPALAGDYNQLARDLSLAPANVIGHSLGGLIALYAMHAEPALWNRAVLLDPVGAKGVQFGPEMFAAFTQMSETRSVCETIIISTIHEGNMSPALRQRIVDDAFGVDKPIWHGVPTMLRAVNFQSELQAIPHPTLVLHGELDPILQKSESEALARDLPHGQFQELPGRGHSCNVEDPELFVRLVDGFF